MTAAEKLVSVYADYVPLFNKRDYKAAFARYSSDCAVVFASLGSADTDQMVRDVFAEVDRALIKRFGRKARAFDIRTFLCVYLCPAALAYGSAASETLAKSLSERWNKVYPNDRFQLCRYEEIASGFRDKPFGF